MKLKEFREKVETEIPEPISVEQEGKTLEEFQAEYKTAVLDWNVERENCAREGLSYDDMVKKLEPLDNKIVEIDREIRRRIDPELDFGRTWKGKRITIKQFINQCKSGKLTDKNGYGYYATNKGVASNIKILPSDIVAENYREDFTHVMWFETM